MNRFTSTSLFLLSCLLAAGSVAPASAASAASEPTQAKALKPYTGKGLLATQLRCEYLPEPLGIDEVAPRLSWQVQSGQRSQSQVACRLLVASSQKLLSQGRGDLWDSGKLVSDETIGLAYAGQPLSSHQHCYWKVKVWDKEGRESDWSQPASWSMGLLSPQDWKGDWIGFDKPRQVAPAPAPLQGAQWLWHAADPAEHAPKGQRLFFSILTLPAQSHVKHAQLYATADDGMKFVINGSRVLNVEAKSDAWRQVRSLDVTAHLKPGENQLRVLAENAKAGSAGFIAKLLITFEDGTILTHVSDASWKSTDLLGSDWITGPTDISTWPNARVVAEYGAKPWGKLNALELLLPPASCLRTQFRIDKPLARATLYASALGLADLLVNGQRVSEDFFLSGWSDYAKRVYYRTYDVTGLVRKGDNALAAMLADGWFSGYVGYRGARELYGKKPRLRAQLHLEFADGSSCDVASGPDWKASTGPVLQADFLHGETYDARLEQADWAQPGCDSSRWDAVDVGSQEFIPCQAHPGPAVRALQSFQARSITEPKPGLYVLDLGQNFAGVPRLKVRGQPGQKITLRFAERLSPDGTIFTANLRSARATDTYFCRGNGVETWQPRFTFHGFQYIEISGLSAKPALDTVVGLALSSDTPVSGQFSCSDPMLNRLRQNIYWTQRANFIDIPTDCPQRDERLGWTGDAQVYVRTATLNTDVQTFFKKWLVDLDEDGQSADGQFPCVAPVQVASPDGGPAWADAGVICPWTIYSVYGDRRVLEKHYAAMTRFIEFCRQRSTPELLPPAKFHCYGDWLSINAETSKELIYSAYFAYSTKLVAQAAEVLGKTQDAATYNALFENLKSAFNKAYVAPDGRIKSDTQASYVLALAFDLLDKDKAQLAAQYLVEDIQKRDWHLSTGFIGTKDLMLVLSKIGRPEVACRLLHNETFPSWGFSIKQGATSIWERWDGWTPEKGFQSSSMNSFAHYSFGAVYQWMVENLGGIRTTSPAYKTLRLEPLLDERLSFAKVSYESIRGTIATEWHRTDGKLELQVTIPANTTATLALPAPSAQAITESGRPLTKAQGVRFIGLEGSNASLALGSGTYKFQSPLAH